MTIAGQLDLEQLELRKGVLDSTENSAGQSILANVDRRP